MNKLPRYMKILLSLAAVFAAVPAFGTQSAARKTPDEFFIISSVNLPKHSLVLKLPSEVTLVMGVTPKTVILDENGKRLTPNDLRAGDTAYITYTGGSQAASAVEIRLGPMTVKELQRRYLNGLPVGAPPPPPAATRPAPHPTKNLQRSGSR